jgi:hypothetical protein
MRDLIYVAVMQSAFQAIWIPFAVSVCIVFGFDFAGFWATFPLSVVCVPSFLLIMQIGDEQVSLQDVPTCPGSNHRDRRWYRDDGDLE